MSVTLSKGKRGFDVTLIFQSKQECIPVGCVSSARNRDRNPPGHRPHPVNRITDRCKSITFPQLLLRTVMMSHLIINCAEQKRSLVTRTYSDRAVGRGPWPHVAAGCCPLAGDARFNRPHWRHTSGTSLVLGSCTRQVARPSATNALQPKKTRVMIV